MIPLACLMSVGDCEASLCFSSSLGAVVPAEKSSTVVGSSVLFS